MLPKILNYDHLYNTFNLNIPLKFNIASATIDKFANTNRVALKTLNLMESWKIYLLIYSKNQIS